MYESMDESIRLIPLPFFDFDLDLDLDRMQLD